MTGRHAAPPDELFDQRERDRAGSHRADVPVPLGPEDLAAAAPAKKASAKKAPVTKAAPAASPKPASSKRAGKK